jgi:hypothetical protein
MHAGMQRLHAPVHHLGKAGDVGDVAHLEARRCDRRLRADEDAGLRAAQELVARERDEVRACGDHGSGGGLAGEPFGVQRAHRPRTEILEQGDPLLFRQARELAGRGLFGEADDGEVALVHLHQQARLIRAGVRVVGEPGAVGGADLDEARARLRHHLGHGSRRRSRRARPARRSPLSRSRAR